MNIVCISLFISIALVAMEKPPSPTPLTTSPLLELPEELIHAIAEHVATDSLETAANNSSALLKTTRAFYCNTALHETIIKQLSSKFKSSRIAALAVLNTTSAHAVLHEYINVNLFNYLATQKIFEAFCDGNQSFDKKISRKLSRILHSSNYSQNFQKYLDTRLLKNLRKIADNPTNSLNEQNLVEKLLRYGANPNAEAENDSACLLWAAWIGNTELINLLLKMGARINKRSPDGRSTELMMATSAQKLEAIEILLHHGSDPNAKDSITQQTSYDIALNAMPEGKDDIIKLLESMKSKIDFHSTMHTIL